MRCKLTLCSSVTLILGAVLAAQPPPDFEASVKAAMAPSIAQQRAAIQKQAASQSSRSSWGPPLPFSRLPFPPDGEGVADCDPLPAEQLDPLIQEAAQKTGRGSAIGTSGDRPGIRRTAVRALGQGRRGFDATHARHRRRVRRRRSVRSPAERGGRDQTAEVAPGTLQERSRLLPWALTTLDPDEWTAREASRRFRKRWTM